MHFISCYQILAQRQERGKDDYSKKLFFRKNQCLEKINYLVCFDLSHNLNFDHDGPEIRQVSFLKIAFMHKKIQSRLKSNILLKKIDYA